MQGIEREIASRLNQTVRADENVFHKFIDATGDLAVNLVVAVVILTVTWWAAGWASRLVRRLIARVHGGGPPDVTLQGFAGSAARYLVMIVGIIAVLQQLGVQTTSILAVLGAGHPPGGRGRGGGLGGPGKTRAGAGANLRPGSVWRAANRPV